MGKNTRRVVAAGAGAALLVLSASAAQAKIVDEWTDEFGGSFDVTCEFDPAVSDDIPLRVDFEGELSGVLRERAPGGPLYFTGRGHRTEVVTNTESGVSWSLTARWQEKDLRALPIDDESTNYIIGLTFHATVFTPDGAVYYKANGREEFVIEVDAEGNGTFVESLKLVGQTGNGLCEDALALTVE